jgi:hypothetical protein
MQTKQRRIVAALVVALLGGCAGLTEMYPLRATAEDCEVLAAIGRLAPEPYLLNVNGYAGGSFSASDFTAIEPGELDFEPWNSSERDYRPTCDWQALGAHNITPVPGKRRAGFKRPVWNRRHTTAFVNYLGGSVSTGIYSGAENCLVRRTPEGLVATCSPYEFTELEI